MNNVADKRLWKVLFSQKMLICLFNGLTAGIPLFFIYQLVPAWLRSEGVDLKTIGLFSLVGIPYTWKFVWSPFMDRYSLPFLGRRRGWMLLTQIALLLVMVLFGFFDPQHDIVLIAALATFMAFFSASQDIVLDAYRRELLADNELGLGNSMYVNGYRAAVFIPGGLGLILADRLSWPMVFMIIGLFMLIGMAKTLLINEAYVEFQPPVTLTDAVVRPFREFFSREGGVRRALLFLAFLFLYKLGDNLATALSTPFYLDLGFSKTVIGSLVKLVSFWAMLSGSLIGGAAIYKIGINRALWIFGFVQMFSILGFAMLSEIGPDELFLALVIGMEYLGVGLGTAALVAFMSKSTNKNFTATQFALFSSLIALPRSFANASSGFLVEGVKSADGVYYRLLGAWNGLGYTNFFIFCTICAIPGMVLLKWVAPWKEDLN
jgi:PAT family beta-lactamase induction signal transducer AmpG